MKAPLPLMRSSATFATSSAVPGQHACMIWLTAQDGFFAPHQRDAGDGGSRRRGVFRPLCGEKARPMPTSARRSTGKLLPTAWGGGVPDAPTIGAQAPIFQTVSGSGARGKPIQSSGYGLPGIPLADREGSQETVGFLRIFCDFLCVQKVTRRRKDKPILPPFLRRNKPPLRCSPGTAQDPRAEAQPRRGPRRARYSP